RPSSCLNYARVDPMLTGKIALRLHLDQTAGGAFELEPQPIAVVQRRRRRGRRRHQLDAAIVELIDDGDEAARGVFVVGGELGNVGDENRVEHAGDVDVVERTART